MCIILLPANLRVKGDTNYNLCKSIWLAVVSGYNCINHLDVTRV